jgi:saccharopine dehydrogenase-like NADP-dependent oxidoreductase
MKVLLVGTGGVGKAIANIANQRENRHQWLQQMVLADYDYDRAQKVSGQLKDNKHFPAEQVNARNANEVAALIRKYDIDLLMNACDPSFNEVLFDTALACDCNYMDMAMSLSHKHPKDPYNECHIKLGDYQFEKAPDWEAKGRLALVGSGVEPGMSDVFARYAEKHLFDSIEEIGVRDGDNLSVEGHDIAFGFSIWTTIEECLNPPVIWERDKGWYTTEPFSGVESFFFPEGIGNVDVVNVEHEEVLLIPRYIDKGLKRVTFKYGLDETFQQALKYLQALNMDRIDMTVKVGESEITPRDFLAKVAPDPVEIGSLMKGKVSAGTWVKGVKDGLERQVYLYQVADNQDCMERFDSQVVVAQTAFNPVIMMELLATGVWQGRGVHGPEAFNPDPFVGLMATYGFAGGLMEMESEYQRKIREEQFTQPL